MLVGHARFRAYLKFAPVVGLFFALVGPNGMAKEGFSTDITKAPPALQRAWDASFALIYMDGTGVRHSTAFLANVELRKDVRLLTFLTVDRNVEMCAQDKECKGLVLFQNVILREGPRVTEVDIREGLRLHHLHVLRLPEVDLAVIETIVPANSSGLPVPAELPTACELKPGDPLFAVGYPSTITRTNANSLPIDAHAMTMKRWSQGVFVGFGEISGMTGVPMISSSVDALNGAYGSPVVDSNGTLVSLIQRVRKADGNAYAGDDNPDHFQYQSAGISCEVFARVGKKMKEQSEPKGLPL